jgi:hypothetical protein
METNFLDKLKAYFDNTPREKVLEDWNKSADLDKVGPTIDEFLENINNSCNEVRKSFLTADEAIIRMKEFGSQISKD